PRRPARPPHGRPRPHRPLRLDRPGFLPLLDRPGRLRPAAPALEPRRANPLGRNPRTAPPGPEARRAGRKPGTDDPQRPAGHRLRPPRLRRTDLARPAAAPAPPEDGPASLRPRAARRDRARLEASDARSVGARARGGAAAVAGRPTDRTGAAP